MNVDINNRIPDNALTDIHGKANESMVGGMAKGIPANNDSSGITVGTNETGKNKETVESKAEIQMKKRAGLIECQTCKNRLYQDQSNDSGVSFKTAGHIDPAASGAVVMSHEMEHVSNESARAKTNGREIVSQSVTLETSICPECGRVYISGGETRTTTASIANTGQQGKNGTGNILDIQV